MVSKTKTFDLAAELAFKKIGEEIDKNAHNPEVIKKIGKELITEAPAIVGAVVKGTQAEVLVDPATIHKGG
jgi:hypothetical protein